MDSHSSNDKNLLWVADFVIKEGFQYNLKYNATVKAVFIFGI
jgi:hypothetical protein